MSKGPYQAFTQRLITLLKEKGHTASRSPNGICINALSQFTGASDQICRRYIRGEALPDYEKMKRLAEHLQVNAGWLMFGDEEYSAPSKDHIDEKLLHYILKQSHHLYRYTSENNDDYADFVLGLIKDVRSIDTTKENLLKIINLAIGSVSTYEESRNRNSQAV